MMSYLMLNFNKRHIIDLFTWYLSKGYFENNYYGEKVTWNKKECRCYNLAVSPLGTEKKLPLKLMEISFLLSLFVDNIFHICVNNSFWQWWSIGILDINYLASEHLYDVCAKKIIV